MKPRFFTSQAAFRKWLDANHDRADELLVGLRKVGAGKAGLTYKQALDEALCFGWIDGVRRTIDDESYSIRFTPRRARSIWSQVNIRRMNELIAAGVVKPEGLRAFEGRDETRTKLYSYENRTRGLDVEYERQFRANAKAWKYFEAQPPWYRRTSSWWVMSAKKEETRARRLATLIDVSAKGEWIAILNRPK
ncbi:MAG TPA: YdeI/OmpD-associated family protein [Thermoanaerobaculia bacterium]|nr:YdeI/OmpD-associated family protein [Thermoanaerobaculia bacterium]